MQRNYIKGEFCGARVEITHVLPMGATIEIQNTKKVIKLEHLMQRQIKTLTEIAHPNIVQVRCCCFVCVIAHFK